VNDWMEYAACSTSDLPSALWTDKPDGSQWGRSEQAQAVAVCRTCPVAAECLRHALRIEARADHWHRHGIWGGATPVQRHDLARQVSAP